MALSADSLAEKIIQNLLSEGIGEVTSGQLEKWARAIAQAIVEEIQENSELDGTDSTGGTITGRVI